MENQSQNIIALLGPTNTGKTHVAIEKMLEYETGIFGLPLRLLAREVYDKCIEKVGIEKVALILYTVVYLLCCFVAEERKSPLIKTHFIINI